MAISGFPVQEGDNLQSLSLNKTLVEMYLERYVGINGSVDAGSDIGYNLVDPFKKNGLITDSGGGMVVPESGTCIQAIDIKTNPGTPINVPSGGNLGLRYLQEMTEQISLFYADTNTFNDDFEGLASVSGYTLESWRSTSNMNAESGYVRKYPRTIQAISGVGTLGHRAYLDLDQNLLHGKDIYEYDGSLWILSDNQKLGPDIISTHGLMEEGDYIGPWIYNDLCSGLVSLKWARHSSPKQIGEISGQTFVTYESGVSINVGGINNDPGPWEDMIASGVEFYNSIDPYSYGIGTHVVTSGSLDAVITVAGSSIVAAPTHGIPVFAAPSQLESLWRTRYDVDDDNASLSNIYASRRFLGITVPSGLVADIEVYGFFAPSGAGFIHDSTNLGSHEDGEISSIHTESYISGLHEISLGNLDLPVEPPNPPPSGGAFETYGAGFSRTGLLDGTSTADSVNILLKYDNPSGFKYQ